MRKMPKLKRPRKLKKQINKRMLAAKIIIEGVLIALNNKLNKQQIKLAIKRILQTNSY